MERLTYRPTEPYISETSGELVKAYSDYSAREIINRLADYEDTGLTPERVMFAKTIIDSVFNDASVAEHIRELLKADKEGRLIIVNDTPRQTSPCDTCESGWGYSTANGNYDLCFDVCEKLAEYRKRGADDAD